MKIKKKNINDIILALKQNRKNNRDEEIRNFGHPICYSRVFKSKKKYNRKEKHKNIIF